MNWLIDKIQELFCDHEWECLVEEQPVYEGYFSMKFDTPSYYQWIYFCRKCGRKKKITSK